MGPEGLEPSPNRLSGASQNPCGNSSPNSCGYPREFPPDRDMNRQVGCAVSSPQMACDPPLGLVLTGVITAVRDVLLNILKVVSCGLSSELHLGKPVYCTRSRRVFHRVFWALMGYAGL